MFDGILHIQQRNKGSGKPPKGDENGGDGPMETTSILDTTNITEIDLENEYGEPAETTEMLEPRDIIPNTVDEPPLETEDITIDANEPPIETNGMLETEDMAINADEPLLETTEMLGTEDITDKVEEPPLETTDMQETDSDAIDDEPELETGGLLGLEDTTDAIDEPLLQTTNNITPNDEPPFETTEMIESNNLTFYAV